MTGFGVALSAIWLIVAAQVARLALRDLRDPGRDKLVTVVTALVFTALLAAAAVAIGIFA